MDFSRQHFKYTNITMLPIISAVVTFVWCIHIYYWVVFKLRWKIEEYIQKIINITSPAKKHSHLTLNKCRCGHIKARIHILVPYQYIKMLFTFVFLSGQKCIQRIVNNYISYMYNFMIVFYFLLLSIRMHIIGFHVLFLRL